MELEIQNCIRNHVFKIWFLPLLVFFNSIITHKNKKELKRFSGQRYRTKLTAKVNFPLELDIGQFTGQSGCYYFILLIYLLFQGKVHGFFFEYRIKFFI